MRAIRTTPGTSASARPSPTRCSRCWARSRSSEPVGRRGGPARSLRRGPRRLRRPRLAGATSTRAPRDLADRGAVPPAPQRDAPGARPLRDGERALGAAPRPALLPGDPALLRLPLPAGGRRAALGRPAGAARRPAADRGLARTALARAPLAEKLLRARVVLGRADVDEAAREAGAPYGAAPVEPLDEEAEVVLGAALQRVALQLGQAGVRETVEGHARERVPRGGILLDEADPPVLPVERHARELADALQAADVAERNHRLAPRALGERGQREVEDVVGAEHQHRLLRLRQGDPAAQVAERTE